LKGWQELLDGPSVLAYGGVFSIGSWGWPEHDRYGPILYFEALTEAYVRVFRGFIDVALLGRVLFCQAKHRKLPGARLGPLLFGFD
jgi:hypothetical protein